MMTLTVDQPMQAATLNSAMMMPPTQPKEKREMVIWRKPSLGPRVEKKATGKTPSTLKIIITATLSQKPRPNITLANAPRAIVEITRLADSHIVKLSKMRMCVRVWGETRSMPCVSNPCSSGINTVSVAILLFSWRKKLSNTSVKIPLQAIAGRTHLTRDTRLSEVLHAYESISFY